MNTKRIATIAIVIGLAALSRLLPHPPNVAPIAAMALFGGAYLSDKRLAFVVPMMAMFLSDLILGFTFISLYVYAAFAAIVGIGFLLRDRINLINVTGASLGGSLLFYLVTNFGVWLGSTYYAQSIEGLIACYVAAIPFFHYTLLGDLFFVSIMFGAFELLKQKNASIRLAGETA